MYQNQNTNQEGNTFEPGVNHIQQQVAERGELVPYVSKRSQRRAYYVKTPDVSLGGADGSAKGVFLRADIARETALEVLRICDENGL